MIKLTLNPDKEGVEKKFEKKTVIIGSAETPTTDICLTKDNLEPIHLKIEENLNGYYVLNIANDPFVTLNGIPFGRKKINNNDVILIGSTSIRFNIQNPPNELTENHSKKNLPLDHEKETWLDTSQTKLHQIIEDKISLKIRNPSLTPTKNQLDETFEESAYDFSSEMTGPEEEFGSLDLLEDEELKELLNDVNYVDNLPEITKQNLSPASDFLDLKSPPPAQNNLDTQIVKSDISLSNQENEDLAFVAKSKINKTSLKDDYLSDFDDESEVWNQQKRTIQNETKPVITTNWKTFGVIAIFIFLIFFIVSCLVYMHLRTKNYEDELEAVEGVADIAMALAFAQLNHIKPLNQNWSDPDFLRNNLMAVLAPEYSPAPFFDNHGQFKNNEYSLRIYSSTDLSQSLIIAQPAPSLLQWLVPKASILVDSKSMEIRRTTDLKSLNRLLLNPNTLEGLNAVEVSNLIKQGEIISFSALSTNKDLGYVLTKSLSLWHPGAENAIYNAPRYYPFSEMFLKKAMLATDNQANTYERSVVQEEIKQLAKYPNIVLYTTKGIQWLQKAQKSMGLLYPDNNFLFATIRIDAKGKILDSHLFMDDNIQVQTTEKEDQDFSQFIGQGDKFNSFDLEFIEPPVESYPSHITVNEESNTKNSASSNIDPNHALYRKLLTLNAMQKKALLSFEMQLENLLQIEHRTDILSFLIRLQSILKKAELKYENDPEKLDKNKAVISFLGELTSIMTKYQSILNNEQQNLSLELSKLQREFSEMPLSEFMAYVEVVGLRGFGFEEINQINNQQGQSENIESDIQVFLKNIQLSDNLSSLESNVTGVVNILTLDKISDTKKLIEYQNKIRLIVLGKLNDFLLTSGKTLPSKDFVPENRPVLATILKTVWVIDPDEFDFYLNEFDLRLQDSPN